MFKRLISKIFNRSTKQYCRYKSPLFNFIYFTEEEREKIEEFFGEYYDYDFTDYGVIVWEDPGNNRFSAPLWLFPKTFKYNTYIVRESTNLGFFSFNTYSKNEFETKFELVHK